MLDAILERYIEDDLSVEAIIADGFSEATVKWVARQVDVNEYKRRQAAPGIKITTRAFGRDRRCRLREVSRRHPILILDFRFWIVPNARVSKIQNLKSKIGRLCFDFLMTLPETFSPFTPQSCTPLLVVVLLTSFPRMGGVPKHLRV